MTLRTPTVVLVTLALPFLQHAQETGAAFLSLSPSVRSEAFGRVGAFSVGAEAIGGNPARAVPPSTQSQVYTVFAPMDDQTSYGHVAWARAFGKRRNGVGVALTHMRSEPDPEYDSTGVPSGQEFSASDTALSLCLSGRGWRTVRWGLTGKVIHSELAGVQSKPTGALDAGVSASFKKGDMGVAVTSVGPGQKFLDQTDPLPTTLHLDVAWQERPVSLLAGIQQELVGSHTRFGLGFQYQWKGFQVRAGYNKATGVRPDSLFWEDLSAGVGVTVSPAFQIDYTVRESDLETGLLHRAALTWSWGVFSVKKKPPYPPHPRPTPKKVQPAPQKNPPTSVPIKRQTLKRTGMN
jgi:hypothetical protein